jgi:hypothetical protein
MNPGSNRWAFTELGLSRRWQRWVLEGYAGVWFFTANDKFYRGNSLRAQQPIGAGEANLTYYLKPRLWVSLDGNSWTGGRSTINGHQSEDEQRNSRAGATVAIPINQHQSIKLSYGTGTYVRIGGDYKNISVAWQYG